MVSKIGRSIYNHIAAAIRGWKNRRSTDVPGDNRKRKASHRYVVYARRRYENVGVAAITVADMQQMRVRYNNGTRRFINENFFGMNEEQTLRALHCFNSHRSEIYKLYRHIINEI
jgi:hypothetical protein